MAVSSLSMHRTSPLTFTSCAHRAADKSFPNGTSVCDFGPRYKRALTAIQVISMVPERVKWPLTLLLESEEIENEGDRRDSVHEGVDGSGREHAKMEVRKSNPEIGQRELSNYCQLP